MKNTRLSFVWWLGVALIIGSGLLLRYIDHHRRLGEPGLVMARGNVLDESGHVISTNTVALPEQVLGFTSVVARVTSAELGILPSDTVFARRLYREAKANGFAVQTSVVMMGTDRTSIHKPQFCLTGQGWKIVSEVEDRVMLDGPKPVALPVWKMTAEQPQKLADGSERMVRGIYVYWFVADGYVTARHSQRMWWMAKKLLSTGTLQRWAYVSEFGMCLPGQEAEAYEKIKEFIAASVPQYHRFDKHTVFPPDG